MILQVAQPESLAERYAHSVNVLDEDGDNKTVVLFGGWNKNGDIVSKATLLSLSEHIMHV